MVVNPTEAASGSVKNTCGTACTIGGGDVGAPRCGVEDLPVGAGTDGIAGHPGLVLALVGQQGPVIGVAHGVEPVAVDAAHQAGVVDIEPRSRRQANRLESDIAGVGRAAGGEQYLVGLELLAVVENDRDRSAAAGAAQLGHRNAGTDVDSGFGETACDELTDERFHPR